MAAKYLERAPVCGGLSLPAAAILANETVSVVPMLGAATGPSLRRREASKDRDRIAA